MVPEREALSATVKRATGSGRRVLGLQLWALGLVSLMPRTAHAVSARVCIEVNNTLTGLDDYSPRVGGMGVRDLGEDFGRSDQRLAPPGMLVRVATSVNSTVLWGWGPVDNEGCTALFEAGAGEAIDVETYSWSILDTASVVSLSCVDNVQYDCESQGTIDNAVVPMANGDISIIVPGTRWAYAHYAAAFAESRSRLRDDVT